MNQIFNIKKVLVIGAGTMGRGIADWLLQNGVSVVLHDVQSDLANKAQKILQDNWQGLLAKNKINSDQIISWQKNLTITSNLDLQKDAPDLIIEAVIEDLAVKQKLFQDAFTRFGTHPVYASNTSSLSMAMIGKHLPDKFKSRFIGMHFFNPAPVMALVELIRSPFVSQELLNLTASWLKTCKKIPIICQDRPGFVVNRLARNYYGEAMRLARAYDVTSYQLIDQVMENIAGFPMGPFRLMDFIGHDVNLEVSHSIFRAFYHHPRFAPHFLQEKLVETGHLGKKSGQGFYQYQNTSSIEGQLKTPDKSPDWHKGKNILLVLNNSHRAAWSLRDEFAKNVTCLFVHSPQSLNEFTFGNYQWIIDLTILPVQEKIPLLKLLSRHASEGLLCETSTGGNDVLSLMFDKLRAVCATGLGGPTKRFECTILPQSDTKETSNALGWLAHMLRNEAWITPSSQKHFIAVRIMALIINEAFYALAENLCSKTEMDQALVHGARYPWGPWQWLDYAGAAIFYHHLANQHLTTGDPRYAPHPMLYSLHLQQHKKTFCFEDNNDKNS